MTYEEMTNYHFKADMGFDADNDGKVGYGEMFNSPDKNESGEKFPEPKYLEPDSEDIDGDGKVTYEETIGGKHDTSTEGTDKNEDGTLDYKEMFNIPETMSEAGKNLDINGDGKVSYAEAAGIPEPEVAEESEG